MFAIETSGIRKGFKEKEGMFWALSGINLKIKKNQVFGLLGPNGAGKTTLIHILSTILLPNSGTASVLGYDVVRDKEEVRDRIGICMGGTYFYWDMTPREILKYYGMLMGLDSFQRRKRSDKLIRDLGITRFQHKNFGDLSTGMKQKVAIAKSLLNEPEVLFLDEPTAGLDVEIALNIRNYILDLIDQEVMTVVLTSHHLGEVEEMCKRIAIINKGKLVTTGDINKIRNELKTPDIIHVYLSDYRNLEFIRKIDGVLNYTVGNGLFISVDSGLKRMDSIVRNLESRGKKVKDIEIRKASLEDVFLTIVGEKGRLRRRMGGVKNA